MKSLLLTLFVVSSVLSTASCTIFKITDNVPSKIDDELPSQRPVIGIITQTYSGQANSSYIAASYVKYIEMSGAQVLPIFMFNDTAYIDKILTKINGVVFPGTDYM